MDSSNVMAIFFNVFRSRKQQKSSLKEMEHLITPREHQRVPNYLQVAKHLLKLIIDIVNSIEFGCLDF